MVFQLISFCHSPSPLLASGSGFPVETSGSIAFQSDSTLQIDVLTGLLNSSSASLSLYARTGTFSFNNVNDSIIQVTSPDAEGGFEIDINGATQTIETGRFIHRVTILTGDVVTITWGWRLESWIGKYTMFALGMGGLILMVASPTWGIWTFKKKGLDPDSFERLAYAFIIFCIGFGLLIMWLYST